MGKYILHRLLLLIPVILGVSLLVFVFMDLAPGTMLDNLPNDLSETEIARLYHEYGYDRSVFYRYGRYMLGFVRGDLGYSYIYQTGVLGLYLQRLPATLALAGAAVLLAIALSVPLAVLAARRHGSATDQGISALAVLGMSMPNFWLGILLMLLFAHTLHLLPSGGMQEPASLILPSVTLATGLMASLTRTERTALLEEQQKDYVLLARAKGLTGPQVTLRHVLRNTLVPLLTVVAMQLGAVVGGAVVTENVFSWPGVGRLLVDAIHERDAVTATGCLIMTAVMISLIQLAADIVCALINPQVRGRIDRDRAIGLRREGGGAA